jgi:hypothetical protein
LVFGAWIFLHDACHFRKGGQKFRLEDEFVKIKLDIFWIPSVADKNEGRLA